MVFAVVLLIKIECTCRTTRVCTFHGRLFSSNVVHYIVANTNNLTVFIITIRCYRDSVILLHVDFIGFVTVRVIIA